MKNDEEDMEMDCGPVSDSEVVNENTEIDNAREEPSPVPSTGKTSPVQEKTDVKEEPVKEKEEGNSCLVSLFYFYSTTFDRYLKSVSMVSRR
jgi:hypothetical protein